VSLTTVSIVEFRAVAFKATTAPSPAWRIAFSKPSGDEYSMKT
jgi:hypothetical protein